MSPPVLCAPGTGVQEEDTGASYTGKILWSIPVMGSVNLFKFILPEAAALLEIVVSGNMCWTLVLYEQWIVVALGGESTLFVDIPEGQEYTFVGRDCR